MASSKEAIWVLFLALSSASPSFAIYMGGGGGGGRGILSCYGAGYRHGHLVLENFNFSIIVGWYSATGLKSTFFTFLHFG